jgi:glycosyltransferase involved in cell wall biosynthesis
MPSQTTFYLSGTMRERVRSLLAKRHYDAIITHVIRMGPYADDVDHPVKILFQADSNGAALGRSMKFAPWWKRLGIRWERHRVDQYMVHCAKRFRETWVLAPEDRKDLERLGCPRVEMVPHGVDESLFQITPDFAGDPRLMFLGNLSVPHNIDAATYAVRELWPAIRQRWPKARLFLAGADPSPAVRRLGEVEGVEVTGRVPDLSVLWRQMHVMLAPLRFSTGIQNKILEAMAAGVPVVTVPAPAEAIHARNGVHLLTSDTAEGLVEAVNQTLQDPDAARVRAARAREHVRAHFTWDMPVRRMEQLVAETEPLTARGSVA